MANAAGAAAMRAGLRLGASLGAGAGAGLASDRRWNSDLRRLASERFFEADFHVVTQVLPAFAAGAARAASAAAHAEQVFKDIGECRGEIRAETMATAALLERGVTEAVIGRALVRVLEDLVGLVDFLETDFRTVVARILVGMPLHGQLAERGLELAFVGCALNFKRFVVAALGGHCRPARKSPPETPGGDYHHLS